MFGIPFKTILILFSMYNWKWFVSEKYYAPKIGNISEFLESYGYPLETHQVRTEDGHILTVHRIPSGRYQKLDTEVTRPAVFLMHGLILSSIDWVVQGPEKSLGLVLADSGYDVWLGNNRGNAYSRNHVKLDYKKHKSKFFNYSFHEIGLYDLPAMIDHVIEHTGHEKISYIGFSQGVTSYLVMSALKPKYNEKILVMNAYAPVTTMFNATSPIFSLLGDFPEVLKIPELIGWHEMFEIETSALFRFLCQSRIFCNYLFYLVGMSKEQMPDKNVQLTLLSNCPAGISLRQVKHYVQGIETGGVFAPYNGNSSAIKPGDSYDLTKVTVPTVIYYGEEDNLVNQIEIPKLLKKLPNVKKVYKVPYQNFNHLDFLWGSNIKLLIEETLRNLDDFNKMA